MADVDRMRNEREQCFKLHCDAIAKEIDAGAEAMSEDECAEAAEAAAASGGGSVALATPVKSLAKRVKRMAHVSAKQSASCKK